MIRGLSFGIVSTRLEKTLRITKSTHPAAGWVWESVLKPLHVGLGGAACPINSDACCLSSHVPDTQHPVGVQPPLGVTSPAAHVPREQQPRNIPFPSCGGGFLLEEEAGVNCPKSFLCLNSSCFIRAATGICCGQASWRVLSYGISIVLCWQSSQQWMRSRIPNNRLGLSPCFPAASSL